MLLRVGDDVDLFTLEKRHMRSFINYAKEKDRHDLELKQVRG